MNGFAVVELKYMQKKTFVVPIAWIKNYVRGHLSTVEFYCYISTNLNDSPNFEAKYYVKFTGVAGLFKVFVLSVTDSVLDAISYQETKRIKSVPKKFRQPANTDVELSAQKEKRKKKENIVKKAAKETARVKNRAHLADLLATAASQSLNNDDIHENISISAPGDAATDIIFENGIQIQPVIAPIISVAGNTTTDGGKFDIEIQPTINPIVSTATDTGPLLVKTSIPSATIDPIASDSIDKSPAAAAQLLEIGIQEQPAIFGNGPIEISSVVASIQSDIVRLAADGLDLDATETTDNPAIYNFNFTDCGEVALLDEYYENAPSTSEDMPTTFLLDVPLNGSDVYGAVCTYTNNDDSLHSAESFSTMPNKPSGQNSVIDLLSKSASSSTMSKKSSGQDANIISTQVQSVDIDYKKAYLQLKQENSSLGERNLALQHALVAADKALGKVPEVPYTGKDGGRLYNCGVFLNETQCKVLDSTSDDSKYINNVAVAVFGTETLKISSVTGTPSKNYELPAKPGLNPLWLQLIYDLVDAKTNKRLTKAEVNKILNKKISNLKGAEKRKAQMQCNDGKGTAKKRNAGATGNLSRKSSQK